MRERCDGVRVCFKAVSKLRVLPDTRVRLGVELGHQWRSVLPVFTCVAAQDVSLAHGIGLRISRALVLIRESVSMRQ